jgi:eukaryotic-like serine/threonine-protein kinase
MICTKCHRRFSGEHQFCPHDGERLASHLDVKRIRSKPTELAGGVIAGRYQVRGLLGRGGMAQVFLALDKQTGEAVALKLLDTKFVKQPDLRARFLLEAKAAAQITHPSIVRILDVGLREDGAPWMVTEFIFGESLGEWLRRDGAMAPPMAAAVIRTVAQALGAAHRAGVVHRDVKPDNVLLIGELRAFHDVKLVDFGFARLISEKGLTQAGVAVGTIEYMAPEQVVSDAPDARTDVYALGVLMFRMLAGRLPFTAKTEPETLALQLLAPAPAPGLGGAGLAPGLEAILLRALRKRPDNRYPSMEAFLDDLDSVLAGRAPRLARQLLTAPDVYTPVTPFAITAAKFLSRKLGPSPTAV